MKQYDADCYTLKATVNLRKLEEDKALQEALQNGNQEKFIEIMQGILDNKLTWGAHIKRYIYDYIVGGDMDDEFRKKFKWISEDGVEFEGVTDENLREFIKKAFADNGMRNRGSIDPKITSTTLGSKLTAWLNSPVTDSSISREVCFLFCFGLNMDEESASYMLEVLRQPDFNPRDYKEAIYYYCLCNNLQYAGVEEWLKKYDQLEVIKNYGDNPETVVLRDRLQMIKALRNEGKEVREAQFLEYLSVLKSMPANTKASKTRATVFEECCKTFYREYAMESSEKADDAFDKWDHAKSADTYGDYGVWKEKDIIKTRERIQKNNILYYNALFQEEDVDIADFLQLLEKIDIEKEEIPQEVKKLVQEGIIKFPKFTKNFMYKKIGDERSVAVCREDILMIVFMYCTMGMGYKSNEEEIDYKERKAYFVYQANLNLRKCGFGDVYLLNPFDLFLVSCLLQSKPLNYFLNAWKEFR